MESNMIKKIKAEQLKPGFFVHDFNCRWLHHPFLADRTKIKTDKQIHKIVKQGIRELYIDTDKGLDIDDAPTQREAAEKIQSELTQLNIPATAAKHRSSMKDELARARLLIREAKQTTEKFMLDVKLGTRMEMNKVESTVDRMTESVLRNKDALVSLLRIKEVDEYTYVHSISVSALCISFAQGLHFDAGQIKQIGIGGLLHDIGKMKVPPEILNKPGRLTEKEFDIIKRHVKDGETTLEQYTQLDQSCTCVTSHHHERLDGTGYPEGLKGDQISVFGQIAAIVDIYDALSSERCYKKALPPTEALKKLLEWSESYLNRDLVEKFIAHLGIYPIGTLVRLENSLLAIVIDHGKKDMLHPVVRAVYDVTKHSKIEPYEIVLEGQINAGNPYDIVGCESPERWQIDPLDYLY
ncbi:MAG: HD-GYP domain-containing protein [Deltaproteobacteria bacterium]|nr:HD-GYP domain-containing protein [Deltaproteobacteria bacterium]